ncbi:hypothetical protein BU24DRAFT_156864 [Aaosphaeria arxii CBS 175.79]|uniref:Uncharacterized protein n=1 Tax=Aaosphaeria arxii CBS 175.79 TaxID=1450172 RepID=A0A6A5XWK4_9PLEO|nr:uncharacterized protein BU24DRAFT_156864 [Aaosphaeria arxii CBS 175.79]KAF2017715.1 hypothetical protein BU24DRAFT_156864 [Aaosphaeria arxii CBS 175.79]
MSTPHSIYCSKIATYSTEPVTTKFLIRTACNAAACATASSSSPSSSNVTQSSVCVLCTLCYWKCGNAGWGEGGLRRHAVRQSCSARRFQIMESRAGLVCVRLRGLGSLNKAIRGTKLCFGLWFTDKY